MGTVELISYPKHPFRMLEKLAREIVRKVPGVVSVTYNITTKPPSTIEAV